MTTPLKKTVFVVDDEEIISTTLAIILQAQGFDAIRFSQPLEALRAARSTTPDLLLSDVAMPLLSGVDLAIQILAICPDCKVLLFSGQAATADLLKVARQDDHKFELLIKPIHPVELLKYIDGLMGPPPLAE